MKLFFKIFLLSYFFLSLTNHLVSQVPANEINTILYKKELSGGIVFHNYGMGIMFRNGNHITGYTKRFLDIDLVTMKHPKEYRIVNDIFENAKSYIYGKKNNFYILRTGYGLQHKIFEKYENRGIEIRYGIFTGSSLGLIKPIYLYIINNSYSAYEYELTIEKYDPDKHDIDNIFGRAPFTNGLNELQIQPGVYFKNEFTFEYSAKENSDKVNAFELGAIIDIYPKKIPIMAIKNNNNLFLSIYLGFHFGKKK